MKKFKDVLKELEGKGKKGQKKTSTFSRKDFGELSQGLINDSEYEMSTIKTKNGEYVEVISTPVVDFRNAFIKQVLTDHGVDKQEATKAAETYEFSAKQADTLYPIITEAVTQYMGTGKSFTFPNKKDLTASIKLRDVAEHETEYKNRETGEVTKTKVDAHRQLVKKSSAPKWKKTKIK